MPSDERPSAPDYTNAALTMLGVNLFWIFCAIWSLLGFIAVVGLALGLNYGIDRLAAARAAPVDPVQQVDD
ncbi:hypothetical protein [Marinibacterium sp. SX1]|uniref:hypothetical protein n=1 Tax=Marinibacterium sp. SX1 TaxID=3388424 RepID=UPI003D162AFD